MLYELLDGEFNDPAEEKDITILLKLTKGKAPPSYLNFLRKHNGGEGFIGDNYIIIWRADEIPIFNREYEVDQYAPGICLFGSTGGGEAYGFDLETVGVPPIVRVPFVGMDRKFIEMIEKDLPGMFVKLANE